MQKYRRGLVFIFLSLKKNKVLFLYMIIDEIWTVIFIRIVYILWNSNIYITAITKEDLTFDSVSRTVTGDEIVCLPSIVSEPSNLQFSQIHSSFSFRRNFWMHQRRHISRRHSCIQQFPHQSKSSKNQGDNSDTWVYTPIQVTGLNWMDFSLLEIWSLRGQLQRLDFHWNSNIFNE